MSSFGPNHTTGGFFINLQGIGTIATRDSANISSTSDDGTGDYRFSFSSNCANDDYCVATGGRQNSARIGNSWGDGPSGYNTSSVGVRSANVESTPDYRDYDPLTAVGHGDWS